MFTTWSCIEHKPNVVKSKFALIIIKHHTTIQIGICFSKMKNGQEVYQTQCSACHASGLAGAPKFGDATAWAPRIKSGLDALAQSSLKGKGAMGPQGGGEFSDFEITRAVVYMTNKGGAKFSEPAPPAAAASAAN